MLSAILSGLLLYASLPPFDQSYLVWIGLAPLLVALRSVRYPLAFLLGLVAGAVFYGLHVRWALHISDFPVVAFLLIILYGALYVGAFGLLYLMQVRRSRCPAVLAVPVLWVALEFIRSNASFLAAPFALVGYSQHQYPAILQLASLTSVYGLSFLVVLVNTALAEAALWAFSRRLVGPKPSKAGVLASVTVAFATLFLVFVWGAYRASRGSGWEQGILTASLVQGNIPQEEKWDPRFRSKILARYRELTLQASRNHPDLIIWPEAATPGYLRGRDPTIQRAVTDLVRETEIPLLFGSASYAKILRGEKKEYELRNSVFLMDGKGSLVSVYDKLRLLPFGEYLPLEGRFPWPRWLVPKNGTFSAGSSATVFELSKERFGVVICWENFFSDLFRGFVNSGAHFMVNPTNEAWFEPEALRQFLAMSVFRAVENGVTLLRVANTGITTLIDPLGRVRERVRGGAGDDIMVGGILTVSVPRPIGPTFYTRHGDLFALVCTVLASLFVLLALLPTAARRSCKILPPGQSGARG